MARGPTGTSPAARAREGSRSAAQSQATGTIIAAARSWLIGPPQWKNVGDGQERSGRKSRDSEGQGRSWWGRDVAMRELALRLHPTVGDGRTGIGGDKGDPSIKPPQW